MPVYLFHLGREPELSIAELEAVFESERIPAETQREAKTMYRVRSERELPVAKLIDRLGGTVKILELVGSAEHPEQAIHDYLTGLRLAGKLNFSLTGPNAERLAIETKKSLKSQGRSVRYIAPKNTATILHNGLVESGTDLTIIKDELFVTRAIQPIEAWSERDFGRPGFDPKSGMLPPKLARLMINLTGATTGASILDPFCGSGTILVEAMSLGFTHIVGSDHSPKAIKDSKNNAAWYTDTFGTEKNVDLKLHQTDARELFRAILPESIDAVASEPYLGKPLRGREPRSFIITQAKELAELYAGTFRALAKVMKPGGSVVFIFPEFNYHGEVIKVDSLGSIKKTGFEVSPLTKDSESLLYARPGQWVGRRIWRFKKTP